MLGISNSSASGCVTFIRVRIHFRKNERDVYILSRRRGGYLISWYTSSLTQHICIILSPTTNVLTNRTEIRTLKIRIWTVIRIGSRVWTEVRVWTGGECGTTGSRSRIDISNSTTSSRELSTKKGKDDKKQKIRRSKDDNITRTGTSWLTAIWFRIISCWEASIRVGAGGFEGSLDGDRIFPAPPRPVEYIFVVELAAGTGSRPRTTETSGVGEDPSSARVREREVCLILPTPPLPVENASRPRDCERSLVAEDIRGRGVEVMWVKGL